MLGYYQQFRDSEEQYFRFGIGENLNFVPHMHQQYEFIYILEGTMQATVNADARQLSPGDAVFIAKNRVHSYSTSGYCKYFLAICHSEKIQAYDRILRRKEIVCPFIEFGDKNNEAKFCMLHMIAEKEASNKSYILDGYLQVLMGRIFEQLELKEGTVYQGNSTQRVLTYIGENFDKPITLDSLAAEVGLSRFYLSRIFNTQIGYSFSSYLNYMRVNYAKRLLEETSKSISDICFDCGFESMRTFNRVFKELTDYSPSVYRQSVLG